MILPNTDKRHACLTLLMRGLFQTTVLLTTVLFSVNGSSAVILQYHHVSDSTPRSTSLNVNEFTAHLEWLERNHFTVIPLPELIYRIKTKQLTPEERLVSITFDDTGKSVCTNAAPLLVDRQWPFSVFINTGIMTNSSMSQCSWTELKKLQNTGLLHIGNHSHSHLHMTADGATKDIGLWQEQMRKEVISAEQIIEKNLGVRPRIFAYPYGEFDQQLQKIVENLGYSAVGQHSGAVGNNSELGALPRFPLSGVYADIRFLADKLLSVPFPLLKDKIEHYRSSLVPIKKAPINKAPLLTLILSEPIKSRVQCFLGNGQPIDTVQTEERISAQSQTELIPGRNRYNCTAISPHNGRFYWYSRQWIQ